MSRTSLKTTLPLWKLGEEYKTALGSDDKERLVIELICPRSWCQGITVVEKQKWWRKNIWEIKRANGETPLGAHPTMRTRACPYCNNMSRIPKRP